MMKGQVGCVAPGAFADLIVAADGQKLRAIMRGGELVKNVLH